MADEVKQEQSEEVTEVDESTDDSGNETKDTEGSGTEGTDDNDDDVDIEVAKELYRKLNNPNTAPQVLKNLSKTLGVNLVQEVKERAAEGELGETKAEQIKSIQELLDEELPPAWKAFGPVLAKSLEKIIAVHINPKFQKTTAERDNERAVNALTWLSKEYPDADTLVEEMQAVGKFIKPGKLETQADYNRYIKLVYLTAKADSGKTSDGKVNDKVAKALGRGVSNAKRALPGPSDVSRVKTSDKYKTPMEAIQAAMKAMEKESQQ